jgi:MFS family permease
MSDRDGLTLDTETVRIGVDNDHARPLQSTECLFTASRLGLLSDQQLETVDVMMNRTIVPGDVTSDQHSPDNYRSLDAFMEIAAASGSRSGRYEHIRDSVVADPSVSYQQQEARQQRETPFGQKWRYQLVFFSLGLANSADATEILGISYVLADPAFRSLLLQPNESFRGGLLAATIFAGMLVGGLLVGAAGDEYGRRPMLLIGLGLNAAAGLLSSIVSNIWTLAALRLVAGLGIGTSIPPLFAICSELAIPSQRGFYITVIATFWMIGSIYVAISGYLCFAYFAALLESTMGLPCWRVFVLSCALPSTVGFIFVYQFVPESPRFLAVRGRYREAAVVTRLLAQYLHFNGPAVTVRELQHHYPRAASPQPPSVVLQQASWSSGCGKVLVTLVEDFLVATSRLYTNATLRHVTIPLQVVWFSLSFGSYGLFTWINTLFYAVHLRNVYGNALLFALSSLPGNILSACLMDHATLGRSKILVASLLCAALSLIVFAFFANDTNRTGENDNSLNRVAHWIVGAACAFQCFSTMAWNAIDVLTSELFPTTVRSTGMGVCTASGRIGAMLAQLVNGVLVSHPVRLLLVAASTLLLGALTPVLLPSGIHQGSLVDTVADGPTGRNGPRTSTAAARLLHSSSSSSSHGSAFASAQLNDSDRRVV